MADIEENPSSRAQSILSRPGSAPSVHSVHSTHSQDTANSSSATSSSVGCAVTHGQQQGGSIPAGSKGPQGRGFSHQLGSLPAPQPGGGTASTRSSKSPESRVAPPAAGAIAATSASKSRIPVPMSMVWIIIPLAGALDQVRWSQLMCTTACVPFPCHHHHGPELFPGIVYLRDRRTWHLCWFPCFPFLVRLGKKFPHRETHSKFYAV